MNKKNAENFDSVMEAAVDFLGEDIKRQVLETLARVENQPDEEIKEVLDGIREKLYKDFDIIA